MVYAVIANEKTIPIFSPSVDSSFAIYPHVNGSTCLVSVFLVTYPKAGLLDIFLFYNIIANNEPPLYDCETPSYFLLHFPVETAYVIYVVISLENKKVFNLCVTVFIVYSVIFS